MEDTEVFEIQPLLDPKDKKAQRRLIWVLMAVFLALNIFLILTGTVFPEMAANIVTIIDIIFWFDISVVGIVGSYFGVDIVTNFTSRQIVTMKKIT